MKKVIKDNEEGKPAPENNFKAMARVIKNKPDEQSKGVKLLSLNQYDTLSMGVLKSKALAYAITEIAQSDAEINDGHLLTLSMMLEQHLQEAGDILEIVGEKT